MKQVIVAILGIVFGCLVAYTLEPFLIKTLDYLDRRYNIR